MRANRIEKKILSWNAMARRNHAAATPAFKPLVAYENVENAAKKTRNANIVSRGNIFRHAKKVHMKFMADINKKNRVTGISLEAMNINKLSKITFVVDQSNCIGSPKRAE